MNKKRAIFLDRDGIINIDHGYVYQKEDFEFTEGIFDLLRILQAKGYLLIIVTNQSGIARGYYDEEAYALLKDYMLGVFAKQGIMISAVYHCPHSPDTGCACRKPKAGMLKRAQKAFDLDMKESWMIGDKESDMLAAQNAFISKRILVSKEIKTLEGCEVFESVKSLLEKIERES